MAAQLESDLARRNGPKRGRPRKPKTGAIDVDAVRRMEFAGVDGVAALLDVSTSYLNKLRCSGGGPVFSRFGASVRYRVVDAIAWGTAKAQRSASEVA